MESIPRWTPYEVETYGLEIAPKLASLARERLPDRAGRIWTGNALTWEPPKRFTYIRTGLEYVPVGRRRDLVTHLLGWADRLAIGVFSEQRDEHVTEGLVESWGYPVAGHCERAHREPVMAYRCIWIDARHSPADRGDDQQRPSGEEERTSDRGDRAELAAVGERERVQAAAEHDGSRDEAPPRSGCGPALPTGRSEPSHDRRERVP
jgi:hypothetical protein